MMRDIFNLIKTVLLAVPAAARTTTLTSSACDLKGYHSAQFDVLYGASSDTLSSSIYWSAKLQESSDDAATDPYADVAAADIIGPASNSFAVVKDNANLSAKYSIGYKGLKRYVKVVVTPTGTHSSGTPVAVTAALGHPESAPTGQTVTP